VRVGDAGLLGRGTLWKSGLSRRCLHWKRLNGDMEIPGESLPPLSHPWPEKREKSKKNQEIFGENLGDGIGRRMSTY